MSSCIKYSHMFSLVQYVYVNIHMPQLDMQTYTYVSTPCHSHASTLRYTCTQVPCRHAYMSYAGKCTCIGSVYRVKYRKHIFLPTWTLIHRNSHTYMHPMAYVHTYRNMPYICASPGISRRVRNMSHVCTHMKCAHIWSKHPNRSYVCPFLLLDLEFWNSSVWFALPSIFLDLIFSWHTVLVKLLFPT